jgi:hypothetical protein
MAARELAGNVPCDAGHTEDFNWAIYKSDGKTGEGIAADDVVRFKLADTPGGAPILDLNSSAPTLNGSRVFVDTIGVSGSVPAAGRVRIAQADSINFSGEKHFELNLVDNSESSPADAIKSICFGTMPFKPTQGGALGLA